MGTQGEGALLEINIDWTSGRSLNNMARGLVSSNMDHVRILISHDTSIRALTTQAWVPISLSIVLIGIHVDVFLSHV
jgi:hypothetical protein